MSIVSWLRPGRLGALAAGLLAISLAGCGVTTIIGGSDDAASESGPGNFVVQEQPVTREISVIGRLVFPSTFELTFETAGKVGAVLVLEGDRVREGQVLASLDDIAISTLEQTLAQAKLDLDSAQEALEEAKEEFVTTPLERAEFEAKIASARKDAKDAADKLADFQRDYEKDLAAAKKAKVAAAVALDNALEIVSYYDRDQVLSFANARDDVSTKELAQDKAKDSLTNFDDDFEESVADALVKRAIAEAAFDTAESSLDAFYLNPIRNADEDEKIDLEILRRIRSTLREAETNLEQVKDELATVRGNKLLDLQKRITALAQAESNLVKAKDTLADLSDLVDQDLVLQERLAAAEAAEAALAQAVRDLEEELVGSDQVELAIREQALKVVQEKLNDLLDGPDKFDVAVKEAAVAAAQAQVDDARENFEGATIRSPLTGVVYLVNVAVDDKVNDQSRVMEIVDLTKLEVDGLVDAIDIALVKEGDKANITIASLPGQRFEGVVVQVAEEPRTERGVVSYPVRIAVTVPEGVEVPARLSAVTSTITYRSGN